MQKLIYVTGGARSGKSTFAEEMARGFGRDVVYMATAQITDSEMEERVRKHQLQRPAEWHTIEAYKDTGRAIKRISSDKKALLLDCLTIMVSNLLLEEDLEWDHVSMETIAMVESKIEKEVAGLLEALRNSHLTGIIVSNELGMGVVPAYRLGRIFRDIAGRMNQMAAREADEAYLLVSGLPIRMK